jgi:hypothetical protein
MRDARCGKKGRNAPDAIKGRRLRSAATILGCKIRIASPIAKKIPDYTVLQKFFDKRRNTLIKECFDKSTKFFLALIYCCLSSAKKRPTLSELGQAFMKFLRHRFRIRSGRKRFER